MKEDLKHANELGNIEAFKGTSYWFKRDWKTIKNSFKNTLKRMPFIIIFASLPTIILSIYYKSTGIQEILTLFAIVFPLSLLGYFMFHVMVTKGYGIHPYTGTSITEPTKEHS